jgi:hypothetical protein
MRRDRETAFDKHEHALHFPSSSPRPAYAKASPGDMTVGRRSFSEGVRRGSSIPVLLAINREVAAYWIVRSCRTTTVFLWNAKAPHTASSRRTPEPITTGFSCCATAVQQHLSNNRRGVWIPAFAETTMRAYRDKFFNNRFSAVDANTCIFANLSALPVSSVITSLCGPATAMQLWPAASP